MARRAAALAAGSLGLFHAWLFLGQLWDGRALQPGIALRWGLAAALVGGLIALRRGGHGLFGRRAAVVWLLAALLHGPRAIDQLHGLQPEVWTEVATVASSLAACAALAAGVAVLGRRRHARVEEGRRAATDRTAPASPSDAIVFALFAPRPPPAPAAAAVIAGLT